MPEFQSTFGVASTGARASIIYSLYTVGGVVGSPVGALISDRFGRRRSMFIGAILVIVGAILSSTAKAFPQMVVSRFVLGFGVTMMQLDLSAASLGSLRLMRMSNSSSMRSVPN